MKTITYNPETHVLVPRGMMYELPELPMPIKGKFSKDLFDGVQMHQYAMRYLDEAIAAAPQPEPVDVGSVGWKHDCAALCANDIELWIDRCPHCGKPRHNHPPTDDELLNKAEQVESEPFGYYENGRFSVITDGGPDKYRERKGYQGAIYTTPQPDRTAELEAALDELARKERESTAQAIRQANEIATLKSALKEVKDNIHSAKLCEFNSMSRLATMLGCPPLTG